MKVTEDAEAMLRADLDNENRTVFNYRQRVKECEALGEYGIAEDIREILRQEQEHQTDLATALGEDVPDVSKLAAEDATAGTERAWSRSVPARSHRGLPKLSYFWRSPFFCSSRATPLATS